MLSRHTTGETEGNHASVVNAVGSFVLDMNPVLSECESGAELLLTSQHQDSPAPYATFTFLSQQLRCINEVALTAG